MLISFTVSNYLSFNEEVEFSMIPGKSRSHPHHVIKEQKRGTISVLRGGVIYGANAAGKSNLVKAMHFAREFICKGTELRRTLPVNYFKFDRACKEKPSKFEFQFKIDEQAYAYGFLLDSKKIHSEWLYEISRDRQKRIFERESVNDRAVVSFGDIHFENKDEKKLVRLLKPGENQLFLSQSIIAGVRYFGPILAWFWRLIFVFPQSRAPLGMHMKKDKNFSNYLSHFMEHFNTGISGISLSEVEAENELKDWPEEMKRRIESEVREGEEVIVRDPDNLQYIISLKDNNELAMYKLMARHRVHGGEGAADEVLMELTEESDGSRRLLDLLPALLKILLQDRICLVDELDRSLHPELSYKLIKLFLESNMGRKSQLIATTHESGLLDLDLLRRDEIWFVEKNKEGASTVYSLEEFTPRYDSDIRKGYMLGRFGAIPLIGDPSKLGWL